MPTSTTVVTALLIVTEAMLIGVAVQRGSAPTPSAQFSANTTAEPDSGLPRIVTFIEPKH